MAPETPQLEVPEPRNSVIEWLLDSDPSIHWQVMRDLMDESGEVIAAEQSRVASHGWGARLLDIQGPDGNWGGGPYIFPGWISTTDTLLLLRVEELPELDNHVPAGTKIFISETD
jgi:hypothetical protein